KSLLIRRYIRKEGDLDGEYHRISRVKTLHFEYLWLSGEVWVPAAVLECPPVAAAAVATLVWPTEQQ
ncbi:hypothetical protein EMWEY_00057790, partial [Eimeria maxima]